MKLKEWKKLTKSQQEILFFELKWNFIFRKSIFCNYEISKSKLLFTNKGVY